MKTKLLILLSAFLLSSCSNKAAKKAQCMSNLKSIGTEFMSNNDPTVLKGSCPSGQAYKLEEGAVENMKAGNEKPVLTCPHHKVSLLGNGAVK